MTLPTVKLLCTLALSNNLWQKKVFFFFHIWQEMQVGETQFNASKNEFPTFWIFLILCKHITTKRLGTKFFSQFQWWMIGVLIQKSLQLITFKFQWFIIVWVCFFFSNSNSLCKSFMTRTASNQLFSVGFIHHLHFCCYFVQLTCVTWPLPFSCHPRLFTASQNTINEYWIQNTQKQFSIVYSVIFLFI